MLTTVKRNNTTRLFRDIQNANVVNYKTKLGPDPTAHPLCDGSVVNNVLCLYFPESKNNFNFVKGIDTALRLYNSVTSPLFNKTVYEKFNNCTLNIAKMSNLIIQARGDDDCTSSAGRNDMTTYSYSYNSTFLTTFEATSLTNFQQITAITLLKNLTAECADEIQPVPPPPSPDVLDPPAEDFFKTVGGGFLIFGFVVLGFAVLYVVYNRCHKIDYSCPRKTSPSRCRLAYDAWRFALSK